MPDNFLRDQNNWWFGHLHETATRGCGEDYDYNSLLEKAFKVTLQENNRYWKETMMMDEEFGFQPQIYLGLPQGHVVSVIYLGKPRYEVQYRYGAPTGESYLLAVESGHFVLPGFRWAEIKTISSFVPHIANIALLLLLPAAHVSAEEEAEAEAEILKALHELGFNSLAIARLAKLLVEGVRLDIEWVYDNNFGWITSYERCWRCPKRNESGLTSMSFDFFSAFKNFTAYLNLNKPSKEILEP